MTDGRPSDLSVKTENETSSIDHDKAAATVSFTLPGVALRVNRSLSPVIEKRKTYGVTLFVENIASAFSNRQSVTRESLFHLVIY